MTITMASKHQITIPQKIVEALQLEKGALFNVKLKQNRIELVPLEVSEKIFTDDEYKKMGELFKKEKSGAKKVTQKYIERLKNEKI